MSRVGNRPISIPSGIKVAVEGDKVKVEGKGKSFYQPLPSGFKVEVKGDKISIARPTDSRRDKTMHGTVRSLLQNMIIGLSKGFQKKLLIQGVGYKALMKGKTLVLDVGFTHDINYTPSEEVTIETPTPTEILVKGTDKQKVGMAAAEIREYYPPEPYKGKGIRYEGEYVRQKQGKTVA